MKHFFSYLAVMLLSCCTMNSEVRAEIPANEGKTLGVYYSYTGNCREIVTTLTSQIEADVLEILPAEKGLKYEANNYALGTQLLQAIKDAPDDANSYPAIDPVTTSLNDYQNIIIVTPLWWSQMAAIMQSYLYQSASQMEGKHVGMIVSSHSSGISGVVSDAERLLPNVTWMGVALWINASNHTNRASLIEDWLKTQDFDKENTTMDKMYITIGGQTQSVTLVDNDATLELVAELQNAPITVTLNDNNF
jgi:flavodoxin